MRNLVSVVTLSFLLLCLVVVFLPDLPAFVEGVLTWIVGVGILVGVIVFGPRFYRQLFGRW